MKYGEVSLEEVKKEIAYGKKQIRKMGYKPGRVTLTASQHGIGLHITYMRSDYEDSLNIAL